jgi:DNA-binding MarR family transcriptional regulator
MYLKVPTEMAEYALRENKCNEVAVYLAAQFQFSGKTKTKPSPATVLESKLQIKERTIYKHLSSLVDRNWIGIDRTNDWYHFRGINWVHDLEGWKYSRAVKCYQANLKNIKAFMMASFITSLIETGRLGKETERSTALSKQLFYPISHLSISKILKISISTVKRLVKQAQLAGFIKTQENLVQVTNLTLADINLARQHHIPKLRVELLGYADDKIVSIDRFRYTDNGADSETTLFIQEPNLVTSFLMLKSRRGLSK